MIIYKITNKINGKIYIGQTIKSLNHRWKQHLNNNKNVAIKNAIEKYGKENFTIEEIDGANSLSELNYLEEHYIFTLNTLVPNGYNLTSGGRNRRLTEETKNKISTKGKGFKFTDDAKLKMSESHKGHIVSEETKNKLRNFFKNKPLAADHKQKIRNSQLGKRHTFLSDESKKKISNALKGRKQTPEHIQKVKNSKNMNKRNKNEI